MTLETIPTIQEAVEAQDSEMLAKAIKAAAEKEAENALMEAIHAQDESIKEARGARKLLSNEKKFYEDVIKCLKEGRSSEQKFKEAITGIDVVMPDTLIDTVFDDLETSHGLISVLDVIRTNAKIKVHFANMGTVKKATWGAVDGTISTEISGEFTEIESGAHKLSCYMPVPNSMIDLGPEYLDRFVRTLLYEALANGIEDAVINNLVSTAPLGMIIDFSQAATTSGNVTTYKAQTASKLKKWTPKGLSTAIKKLSVTKNKNPREVTGRLFMAVNSADYIEFVKPAICIQNATGEWVDKSPYAIDIVKSAYIPTGKAVLGIKKQYALAICESPLDGNLEYSDEYKFLEEVRTFKIKLYGDGRPKDDNSFVYLDISELEEAALLTVTNNVTVEKEAQAA